MDFTLIKEVLASGGDLGTIALVIHLIKQNGRLVVIETLLGIK